jgi:hypothetical protein
MQLLTTSRAVHGEWSALGQLKTEESEEQI